MIIDSVPLTLSDDGAGAPVLLLHGGGGPGTVAPFAPLLAERLGARVLVPTHPGFAGTERPDHLTTTRGLAVLYARLLDELDLDDVTVVGNSIGGWVAQELALLGTPRVGRMVLVDSVGVEVAGHPVADFFALTFPELAQLSYHDPERFVLDPASMTDEAQAVLAANRAALSVYAGAGMTDPTLFARLRGVEVPTLVVWGEDDRIADPEYGRALAGAIPGATLQVLPRTGHLPQLETPELLADTIAPFAAPTTAVR
ncbi:alpha/beta hydrolase [Luteimicrobium xylanilyticum]|uniref:Chloride peroxidase n=1 Tax=Luteimicrobium xylanilyticum TaxID=1133546 RepID=A0A5P9QF16_9MICO|nr:alpha/beta hydrolase [Luteimicrobium xylanilyticum]QFU99856.1 Chloride peroxidase [Luteimicrobium xylanilyticum]